MDKKVLNRFKSFGWRLSMMIVVVLADHFMQNISGYGLPAYATITIGLVCGEISKFLNTELSPVPAKKTLVKKSKKKV